MRAMATDPKRDELVGCEKGVELRAGGKLQQECADRPLDSVDPDHDRVRAGRVSGNAVAPEPAGVVRGEPEDSNSDTELHNKVTTKRTSN